MHAAGGDGRVGLGHLHGGHALGAQGDRLVGGKVDVNAHGLGHADHLVRADGFDDLHEARVGRDGECVGEAQGAVALVAEVLDLPGGGELHGGVAVDEHAGVHARVERRC